MAQGTKEQRIHYKLDDTVMINQDELNIYNVPFMGNTVTCRETFMRGERYLEYTVQGDITMENLISKPIFKEELIEYMHSLTRQMISMVHSGLRLEKIILDFKYIYVRLEDFSVQLIYLPVAKSFPVPNAGEYIKDFLSRLTYAHTPAIECANQIQEYFAANKGFNVLKFSMFIKELRASSQLLMAEERVSPIVKEMFAESAKQESAIHYAEEASRNADIARMNAENESKRLADYAKEQARIAERAEEMRMFAEASKVQAEVRRQTAERNYKKYSETAILYAEQLSQPLSIEEMEKINEARRAAEDAAQIADEERKLAISEVNRFSDEVRQARDEEMRAEEARLRAEYESKRNTADAARYAKEMQTHLDEIKRLMAAKQSDSDLEETAVLQGANTTARVKENAAYIIRKNTGEKVYITKQVFCIGKAEQGVDYRISNNKSISRRHAYITNINGTYYIRDNNSTNHTYLNNELVYSNVEVVIPDGSRIVISNEEFIFKNC